MPVNNSLYLCFYRAFEMVDHYFGKICNDHREQLATALMDDDEALLDRINCHCERASYTAAAVEELRRIEESNESFE